MERLVPEIGLTKTRKCALSKKKRILVFRPDPTLPFTGR
ncbi:conserved hypothetical protein [delta proteobacterium NaphS2]|nr:conserved hypothetical protein [delta proteobacterium NaphS2]